MGIFVIAAAVAALVGIIGVIANLAVPAWRPRGSASGPSARGR